MRSAKSCENLSKIWADSIILRIFETENNVIFLYQPIKKQFRIALYYEMLKNVTSPLFPPIAARDADKVVTSVMVVTSDVAASFVLATPA